MRRYLNSILLHIPKKDEQLASSIDEASLKDEAPSKMKVSSKMMVSSKMK
jgi:hypothetical protein